MEFGKRITDRKWYLVALAAFWLLAALLRRGLFDTAAAGILTAAVAVCSFAAVLFIRGMTEKDFLLIACLLGVFFVVIAPFACIIDEKYHFARAFGLSNGDFFHVAENGKLGFRVPAGYAEFTRPGVWNLSNIGELKDIWFSSSRNLEFVSHTRSASYLPLDYLFSAAGMFLARLFDLPLLFVVVFGRLFNYASYVAISYLAIRRAKYYKSLFFLVAVLPSCLYAGAVISIDACLIACCLLYVSIALNCCLDREMESVSVQDTVLLCAAAAFILSTKYFGYFLILPLILFAAKRHLKNYGRLLILLGVVTAGIGIWQVAMIFACPGSIDRNAAFDGVSFSGQIKWILENPGTFLRQLGHQMILEAPQQLYAYSYSEEPLFSALSLPLRFVPFFAAAWAEDKCDLTLKQSRGLSLYWVLSSAGMMALCYIALYLAWTPVGAAEVEGMQFRYATPYLIFILLTFSTMRTENTFKDGKRLAAFLMILQLVNMLTGTVLHWIP